MREYKFYDTDITGKEEYDIIENDYDELIKSCCLYCTVFSVIITNFSNPIVEKLEKFRIEKPENSVYVYDHYGKNETRVRYYQICSELCQLLISYNRSIFSWIDGWGHTNPNDPTFYRDDGTVFFTSTIHEGECTLTPTNNEDVSVIISNGLWKEIT